MVAAVKDKVREKPKSYKFNTFSGVFVPSVLAIFGAVMFLILPRVIGGVGLLSIMAIILLAHSVSIATAFSLSAISTNIKVKGGGLYYLISRSLGSEFGGSLGIQLFLAQAVSVGFYVIAFSQGVQMALSYFGMEMPAMQIAMIACFIFALLAFIGADFVIKIQYVILGAIILSVLSLFFAPGAIDYSESIASPEKLTFWIAFAMFFPAVVGIDAGIGMSGDLKDPKKSLVKGTFSAIIVTMIAYSILAWKFTTLAPLGALFSDRFIAQKVALIPGFIVAGILFATSSSALSYFMTAPRTLRAMVNDNIFPSKFKFFGKGIGNSKEPRIALILTLFISIGIIYSGGLDFVAQIVTIFFLNVYGWINAAAFFEKVSSNPSYRPSFSAPPLISFYGMIISYFIMFLFNKWIMIGSILFQIMIFYILYRTKTSIKLESVWDGVLFQLLRKVLNKIEETERSKKNWRPTIVSFCANSVNRNLMFSLLSWIGSNTGIMKFYYLIKGEVEKNTKTRQQEEEDMKEYTKECNFDLFPKVVETDNIRATVESILQAETIGNLPLNTALIDFDSRFEIDKLAKLTAKLKKNVIILKNNSGFSDFRYIDVWWDDPDNGNLMILIAYLISHSEEWMQRDATIRLFKVVKNDKERDEFLPKLNKLINDSRIDNITLNIVISKKKMPKVIKENSHYADLVLMGMPHSKKGIAPNIGKEIERYTKNLTTTLVVLANDKIDFRIN